ncbi:MAG TPA: DMT family transporter [Ktedonobacteraceae bacterium]|nr:DMT family transporter [Ktedonobacteraceae bacterium]
MGIILGLSAALFWGTADFLVRYTTHIIGTYRTLFYMQFIGLACLSIFLVVSGDFAHQFAHISWQWWVLAIITALLNVVSALALYRAFEIGVLAVVSPIAASSTALTVVLVILSGEMISRARGVGITATLIGVALAATHFTPSEDTNGQDIDEKSAQYPKEQYKNLRLLRRGKLTRGVGWALVSAVCYGIDFWLLGIYIVPVFGGIFPVWIIRFTTICALALFAMPARQNLRWPPRKAWWFIIPIGILDTLAFISVAIGYTTEQVSVVSVLASLFSAVTVLLAWIFLREKLQWSQWLGIVIILLGVSLVKL